MQNYKEGFSETLQRYCHVINSNTTVTRTVGDGKVSYRCAGCDKYKNGCSSDGCFDPSCRGILSEQHYEN